MKIKTRELTLCAVLAALALALSYMESFFPLALIVPLPGVKLGLANIVTLYALYALGFPSALAILLVRCTLGALFAGNASALLFSLLGGLAALLAMALLRKAKGLSIFGVSIAGVPFGTFCYRQRTFSARFVMAGTYFRCSLSSSIWVFDAVCDFWNIISCAFCRSCGFLALLLSSS